MSVCNYQNIKHKNHYLINLRVSSFYGYFSIEQLQLTEKNARNLKSYYIVHV